MITIGIVRHRYIAINEARELKEAKKLLEEKAATGAGCTPEKPDKHTTKEDSCAKVSA